MCLTKRIEPCGNCLAFLQLSQTMDLIEDKMDNNKITEGKYLKEMNKVKKFYDRVTESHKIEGCSDCIMNDDDDDDDSDDDSDDDIEVEPFEWRGNYYWIGEPEPWWGGAFYVTRRVLYHYHDETEVGHVTHVGEVIIY